MKTYSLPKGYLIKVFQSLDENGQDHQCKPHNKILNCLGYTNGATFMRLASEKWRNLPEEEKKFYAARAKQIRDNPLQMMDRKKIIHRQLNIISTAVSKILLCDHCDVMQ